MATISCLTVINLCLAECMVTQQRREPVGKEGKKVQKPCIFPFKFDGEEFDGCINFILERDDNGKYTGERTLVKPWCSTKVDEETGVHVAGGRFYGDCDEKKPQCPNAGGYHPPMKEQITGAEGKTSLNKSSPPHSRFFGPRK